MGRAFQPGGLHVLFALLGDPAALNLPYRELVRRARWREAMEREPVRFMVDELPEALLAARERLVGFVGAVSQRLTFVVDAVRGSIRPRGGLLTMIGCEGPVGRSMQPA